VRPTDKAACAGRSEAYNLAFSEDIRDNRKMITKFCKVCPIVTACLGEALALDTYGVWGGKTRAERQDMVAMMKFAGIKRQAFR
jgi:hypothetical protein